ncbi:unnamed protein product [Acanthoscelides obtectus]|uniref:Uncharacterized protein n=1 Tax=Acanthoscelides obtectus TaxID=200917 RepID=A0A9P0L4Q8_ACAOB|nr:unnamed protein product [Acanthoscelides obtectus]CAK1626476.1 hypothetical protein AOBTE_LOCUS3867 [Acanthoscelides obtectus]
MCVCMYVIVCGYFKTFVQIDAVLHLLAGMNQIYMCYAHPAQELMFEASKVRSSAYFSQWIDHPEYKKFVILIMTRGQREVTISAGGMVRIDLEMFLMASKTMVSCCMCLQALNSSTASTNPAT